MENNIKEINGEVQVVYTKYGAGCMVFGIGFMALASIFILYLIPSMGIARAFIGIPIGIIGTLFFGVCLLKIVNVLLQGEVILKVENGLLKSKKKSVAIKDIKDISYGWHSKRLSGKVFRDIIVQTTNNKRIFFSYYNLVGDDVIEYFIENHILPHTNDECRVNFEKKSTKS